jgi:tetratricopeptide (TPR) repeat protein
MKHKIKPILYIAGILLLFATCIRQPHASALLQQTDSLLHHHQPDSALQLLFNIKDETSLPEAERMKLVWNKAMAHYQLEMSLLEDSLLYQAIAYYRQQSTDTVRLLDTYLLEGMYLRWKEANDEAITVFDKGIALAISRKDTTNMLVLQRKKLEVLYKQSRFLECKAMIEDMLRIAHKLPVKEHYQMVYSLALVSQLGGDTSNIDCPEKGFQLALEAGDTLFAHHILRNHGDMLVEAHRYREAIAQFQRLIRLNPDFLPYAVQLSLAEIYINLGKNDSAFYYLDKAAQSMDKEQKLKKDRIMLSFKSSYYQMQSALNERMGLPYSGQIFVRYCDSIAKDLKDKHNTALRQQETRAQLQQRNYELIINRQQMELRIAVVVSLLLGVILALIVLYQQNLKKKERTIRRLSSELQKYSKQLKDNEVLMAQNNESIQELQMQLSTQKSSKQEAQLSLIKQLEEQNRQLNLANQNLQHQIKAHWKQLKSVPLKTPHLQELTTEMLRLKEREEALTGQLISTHPLVAELRSKPRFLQPEDFVRIATLVNKIYPHFTERLTEAFPNLTELDQQLCILIKLGFSVSQIAVFMAVSPSSVSQQKSRMKKRILQQKTDSFTEGETLDLWLHRF